MRLCSRPDCFAWSAIFINYYPLLFWYGWTRITDPQSSARAAMLSLTDFDSLLPVSSIPHASKSCQFSCEVWCSHRPCLYYTSQIRFDLFCTGLNWWHWSIAVYICLFKLAAVLVGSRSGASATAFASLVFLTALAFLRVLRWQFCADLTHLWWMCLAYAFLSASILPGLHFFFELSGRWAEWFGAYCHS